jgi:hypothetical protein
LKRNRDLNHDAIASPISQNPMTVEDAKIKNHHTVAH